MNSEGGSASQVAKDSGVAKNSTTGPSDSTAQRGSGGPEEMAASHFSDAGGSVAVLPSAGTSGIGAGVKDSLGSTVGGRDPSLYDVSKSQALSKPSLDPSVASSTQPDKSTVAESGRTSIMQQDNRCGECKVHITRDEQRTVYRDQVFHLACFFCYECRRPNLSGINGFFINGGRRFCLECFNKNVAEKCTNCQQAILEGGVRHRSMPYHHTCFKCAGCDIVLGKTPFVWRENRTLCLTCYTTKFAEKCSKCSSPIQPGEQYLQVENNRYHDRCLVCENCGKALNDNPFVQDGDRNVCIACSTNKSTKDSIAAALPVDASSTPAPPGTAPAAAPSPQEAPGGNQRESNVAGTVSAPATFGKSVNASERPSDVEQKHQSAPAAGTNGTPKQQSEANSNQASHAASRQPSVAASNKASTATGEAPRQPSMPDHVNASHHPSTTAGNLVIGSQRDSAAAFTKNSERNSAIASERASAAANGKDSAQGRISTAFSPNHATNFSAAHSPLASMKGSSTPSAKESVSKTGSFQSQVERTSAAGSSSPQRQARPSAGDAASRGGSINRDKLMSLVEEPTVAAVDNKAFHASNIPTTNHRGSVVSDSTGRRSTHSHKDKICTMFRANEAAVKRVSQDYERSGSR